MNNLKVYPDPEQLARGFASYLASEVERAYNLKKRFSIALSGGSTPKLLFSELATNYSEALPWEIVNFFWGDERCVNPDHPESNFGMARMKLLNKIKIPSKNIFRIRGEEEPEIEATRYQDVLIANLESRKGLPSFDLVILGLGEDGHTASIFPDNMELFDTENICDVTTDPISKQKRITITGPVINNSQKIIFVVSGKEKASVVSSILVQKEDAIQYPAFHIAPIEGELVWHLDGAAATLLQPK